MATKPTTPPPDANGEAERAMRVLKKCRNLLNDAEDAALPDEWKAWVVASLQAGLKTSAAAES